MRQWGQSAHANEPMRTSSCSVSSMSASVAAVLTGGGGESGRSSARKLRQGTQRAIRQTDAKVELQGKSSHLVTPPSDNCAPLPFAWLLLALFDRAACTPEMPCRSSRQRLKSVCKSAISFAVLSSRRACCVSPAVRTHEGKERKAL